MCLDFTKLCLGVIIFLVVIIMEGVHGRRKDMNNFISTIEGFFGIKNGLLLNKLCQFLDGAEYKNLVILSYDSLTVENFKKYFFIVKSFLSGEL